MAAIDRVLDAKAGELATVDNAVMGKVVASPRPLATCVRRSMSLMAFFDDRKFEKAAAAGYQDSASSFIFLQRTLGGLQSVELDRHAFISSVAEELQCAHEEAESFVVVRGFVATKPL